VATGRPILPDDVEAGRNAESLPRVYRAVSIHTLVDLPVPFDAVAPICGPSR
jgi:hypothetical protein